MESASPLEKKEWVDWINVKVLQKAVLVDMEGNMLALCRPLTGPGRRLGAWDMAGGAMGVEDLNVLQNPHEVSLKREILEETGLTIDSTEIVYICSLVKKTQSAGSVLILPIGYRCKINGIKPAVVLSDEHIESRWVTKEEFLGMDFGDDGGFSVALIEKV